MSQTHSCSTSRPVLTLLGVALVSLAAFNAPASSQPPTNGTPAAKEIVLPMPPAPDPVKAKAGQELLGKSRAAYAALTSYQGTTRTDNKTLIDGQPMPGQSGTAKIAWEKPDLLSVTGTDASQYPYSILGNKQGAWYKWPLDNKGEWQERSLELGIASMTGVARMAPTTIPMLLLGKPDIAFRHSENIALEKEDVLDGHPCFKLTAVGRESTRSWWIDKSSFLLRRIEESYSELQSQKKLAQLEASMKKFAAQNPQFDAADMHIDMTFVSDTQEFDIQGINQPIDAQVFAFPQAN
jgi:hypothetical protein